VTPWLAARSSQEKTIPDGSGRTTPAGEFGDHSGRGLKVNAAQSREGNEHGNIKHRADLLRVAHSRSRACAAAHLLWRDPLREWPGEAPQLHRDCDRAYSGNLVDRDLARTILEEETAGTKLPFLRSAVENVMLDHWAVVQWLITALELGVGALLIVGLASRAAALVGLGQQLFLAAVYFSSNRWAFEQPHEYIPLVILALVPSGRVWGLDGRLIRTQPGRRRWPC
jgi:uncharacterized membrane protein YphA (DoxX/SURF4 family)